MLILAAVRAKVPPIIKAAGAVSTTQFGWWRWSDSFRSQTRKLYQDLQAQPFSGRAKVSTRSNSRDRSQDVDGGMAAKAGRSYLDDTSAAIDAVEQDMV